MPDTKVTVTFDAEKLSAIRQFLDDNGENIETVLQAQLEKIYTKAVPAAVRKYIDGKVKPTSVQRTVVNSGNKSGASP